jgi:putative sterol carrier protein
LGAPSALLHTLFEHFCDESLNGCLSGKYCLFVTSSLSGGERQAYQQLSQIVESLGGCDAGHIFLGAAFADATADLTPNPDSDGKEIGGADVAKQALERECEDFFRKLKQSRPIMPPLERGVRPNTVSPAAPLKRDAERPGRPERLGHADIYDTEEIPARKTGRAKGTPPSSFSAQQRMQLTQLYENHKLDGMTKDQDEDVEEITRFFSQKIGGVPANEIKTPALSELSDTSDVPPPREKTCRQMTKALPRHFKPQLSGGLNAVIQLSITGVGNTKNFEGHIIIDGTDCVYKEGVDAEPDVSIWADNKAWADVLRGRFTAQKAFMMGQIRVKGNFVLLTRFDQLFDCKMA